MKRVCIASIGACLWLQACAPAQRASAPSAPTAAAEPTAAPALPSEPVLGRALPSRAAVDGAAPREEALPWPRPSSVLRGAARAKLSEAERAIELQQWAVAERALRASKAPAEFVQLAQIQLQAARESWPTQLGHGEGDARIERALADLRALEARSEAPLRALVQLEISRWALVLGRAQLAREALQAALAQPEPQLSRVAEAQSLLGLSLLALGEVAAALAPLSRAAALAPDEPARHGNLGTALILNGMVREAVRAYSERARLAPDDAQAHADLGVALCQAGEATAGVKALSRAVQLAPKYANFRANLGYALLRSGARSEARAELERALQIAPDNLAALLGLSAWHAASPRGAAEAERLLRRAEALAPDDPRVLQARQDLQTMFASEERARP